MMAFMKFFNYTPEGSMALAEAMGVGRGIITLIGLVEVAVLFLILLPRARAVGALLGVFTMIGALVTHATKIGWSGNAAAEMWPLAIAVLAAASFVLIGRRKELPIVGKRLQTRGSDKMVRSVSRRRLRARQFLASHADKADAT